MRNKSYIFLTLCALEMLGSSSPALALGSRLIVVRRTDEVFSTTYSKRNLTCLRRLSHGKTLFMAGKLLKKNRFQRYKSRAINTRKSTLRYLTNLAARKVSARLSDLLSKRALRDQACADFWKGPAESTPQPALQAQAGDDQTITQPDLVLLSGSISQGPSQGVLATWRAISGPGAVFFAEPDSLVTSASFSKVGTYVLSLDLAYGEIRASDQMTVDVLPKPALPAGGKAEGSVPCNGVDDNLDGIIDNWCQITDRTWPRTYGQAELCLWKDDKLGAVSITIDDNTAPDHEWWSQVADQYGYKLTWFVITERLDMGGYWGTWESFKTLLDKGHDIQSHTVSHNHGTYTLDQEYGLSKEQIEAHYAGHRVLTLAYPGGGIPNDPEIAKKYYIGARMGYGAHNRANSTNYMETACFETFVYDPSHWASISNILSYNPARPKSYRAWECKLYHGVQELHAEILAGLDFIKSHQADFWVGRYREVILFGQERDTAEVLLDQVSDQRIDFRVTDRMDDDIFDYPLTIKLRLDSSWKNMAATQAGQSVNGKLLSHEGETYALVEAAPDRGTVRIEKR